MGIVEAVPARQSLILAVFYARENWIRKYSSGNAPHGSFRTDEFVLMAGFFALPVFATYFALRVKNLVGAAVLTWVALCLPVLFGEALAQLFEVGEEWAALALVVSLILLCNAAFALLVCFLLRHSLSRRIYAF